MTVKDWSGQTRNSHEWLRQVKTGLEKTSQDRSELVRIGQVPSGNGREVRIISAKAWYLFQNSAYLNILNEIIQSQLKPSRAILGYSLMVDLSNQQYNMTLTYS